MKNSFKYKGSTEISEIFKKYVLKKINTEMVARSIINTTVIY